MLATADNETTFRQERYGFDLYVKGAIPSQLTGSLVIPLSRRHKDRNRYLRWHDSQSDVLRLDLTPGRPGKIRAEFLGVDPWAWGLGSSGPPGEGAPTYLTQPNHGVNYAGGKIWVTNLLYGAPLQLDLDTLQPEAVVEEVCVDHQQSRIVSSAHFAFDLERRYGYFAQSVMTKASAGPSVETDLVLVEVDVATGASRSFDLVAPDDDRESDSNFHSCFYFEEDGRRFVGLLRTGAIIDCLDPNPSLATSASSKMTPSTVWVVDLDSGPGPLRARTLPGVAELDGIALSHLDVDNEGGCGFTLFANYKEADISKETIGPNVYGEPASSVLEHYNGMIVEALAPGKVIRYNQRGGETSLDCFERSYDHGHTARGHTWLPINIQLDASRDHVFCTFNGLRPRLMSRYIKDLYPERSDDFRNVRFVPSCLMRLDSATLEMDETNPWSHVSYTEPVAMTVVGEVGSDGYVCTFSPEKGLRIYQSDDLSRMVCLAESMDMRYWDDEWFRGDPAHMIFVPR